MCQFALDPQSPFCAITGTPGKLRTTISRGTTTLELKVSASAAVFSPSGNPLVMQSCSF